MFQKIYEVLLLNSEILYTEPTLSQNHLITLFIPEMVGHVSMLGSFIALAVSMYASLDGEKNAM